jgi:prepilin-type processing-associated H-X9-DG protein
VFEPYDSVPERHLGGLNVAFLDGHVKWLRKKDALYTPPGITVCSSVGYNSTDPKFLWNR